MNKRVPLLLLFILFLCIWGGPLFAQGDSLIIQPGFGDPGSSGNLVSIDLRNTTDVGKVQFTLNYDPSLLTVTDVVKTSRTESMSVFNWREAEPGSVSIFIWDLEGNTIGVGSGSIVNVSFDVVSGIPYGIVPLTLSLVIVNNAEGGVISPTVVHGTFTITEPDIGL